MRFLDELAYLSSRIKDLPEAYEYQTHYSSNVFLYHIRKNFMQNMMHLVFSHVMPYDLLSCSNNGVWDNGTQLQERLHDLIR